MLGNILGFIGKHSLYIYLLHVFAFKPLSFMLVELYNLPWESPSRNLYNYAIVGCIPNYWWIFYTILGVLLPLVVVLLIERLKRIINNKHKQTF